MKNTLVYMKFTLAFLVFFVFNISAQVEVRSTSPNSVLAITSPDKAVLLPRVNNTDLVNSPEEGLFVYNKDSKTPSYHDGVQWNNMGIMMMPTTSQEDSLTYTVITGYGPPFPSGGPYPLENVSSAISSGDLMSPGIFNITKKPDLSTTGLMYMLFDQTTSNNVTIEIEVYKNGETSPYFAYKLKDIQILALQVGNQNGTVPAMESYTLGAKLYGYNNIESNRSVAFNTNTASIITYGSF